MTWAKTGWNFEGGWFSPPAAGGGGGPSYAELATIVSTSNTATTTWDVTLPASVAGGVLVVACGYGGGGLSGCVFDPAGQNVTLTAQANDGGGNAVLFSATVSAAASGKTLRFTAGASTNGQTFDVVVWLIQSATSATPTATAGTVGSGASISATASQFLFCFAYFPGARTPDWVTNSTQAPSHTYDTSDSQGHGADWTVSSTNASFVMSPNSGAYYIVAAQYH